MTKWMLMHLGEGFNEDGEEIISVDILDDTYR